MDIVRFKGARHAARIDQQVGERIRKRRTLLGFTQEQLAEALDISYQQIQKYETGANRVSAGRLFQIAQRLQVPISFFFEDLGIDYTSEPNGLDSRSAFELIRSFQQISDNSVRNAILALVKSVSVFGDGASRGFSSMDLKRPRNGGPNDNGDGHVD